jgi:molybdate transport system substrate-binding protein
MKAIAGLRSFDKLKRRNYMHKSFGLLLAMIAILSTMSCQKSPTAVVTLNVSAAATLSKSLDEINALYESLNPGVIIVSNYASSGTLQTQIENGAPCDVFLSAATTQMDNLQAKGLLLANTRRDLLKNHLALVVLKDSTLGITSFADLAQPRVKLIAIGDPASVPTGVYGVQEFKELGILDSVQSKFILGASTPQVLQYVDSGDVDAGIVFSTDALSDSKVTMVAVGSTSIDDAIIYPVAVIKSSKNASAASDYLSFLFSAKAKTVFERYGFSMVSK